MLDGPVCVRAAGKPLVFWIAANRISDVVVELDGKRYLPELVEVAGGFRFSLDQLDSVRQIFARNGEGASLELPLAVLENNPDVDAADQLRKDPKTLEAARAHATKAISSSSSLSQARAMSLMARIKMRGGDYRGAVYQFDEALRTHQKVGCLSAQYRDAFALAYGAIYQKRDFYGAQAVLQRAEALSDEDTDQRAQLPYYQGLLASETGRLGSALAYFHEAEIRADRLQLTQQVHDVRMQQINILTALGRRSEAISILKRVASTNFDALGHCKRAEVMNNIAWRSLLLGENPSEAETPLALATAAEALYREAAPCDDPRLHATSLGTLALAQFEHGEIDAAERSLNEAEQRKLNVDPTKQAERLSLRARIAGKRGQPEAALKIYAELSAVAKGAQLPFVRWRGLIGEAETLEAMHRDREALARYDAADELFRELLALVPLGDGRDDFALRHERAAARHVGLLVRLKETDRAMEVARISRVRALGLLDVAGRVDRMSQREEKSWITALNEYRRARDGLDAILTEESQIRDARLKMPADQLQKFLAEHANIAERGEAARRALKKAFDEAMGSVGNSKAEPPGKRDQKQLADGELLLVYHPVPEGWVAFARTNVQTRMEILPTVGDATSLLSPFTAELDKAKRVIVMPSGALEEVNFHAVLAGDRPLGMRVKLSYGIDVESAAKPKSNLSAKAGGLAVIVAVDPTDTLKTIEREARAVSEILSAQGYEVVTLFGEKATRAELSRWLSDPRVTHFHFAGHAVSGGRDGLESRLLLADGSLTGTDLLALGRAPRDVVISACEAGKASTSGGALGLGLAQAFILAGAKRVVASSAPAEDTRTFEMMKAAYESGSALDPGVLVKAAFEAPNNGKASAGWDSFRVVEAW